ncbi:MAG: ABC transporter ATP-binding protein [Candidatus Kariarchaeaceae archaeon]
MEYKNWLFHHILREKLLLLYTISIIFFSQFFVLTSVYTGKIIDELNEGSFEKIVQYGIIILLLFVLQSLCHFQYYFSMVLGHSIIKNINEEFFESIVTKSQSFHDRAKTGDLMSRATNDTQKIHSFIEPGMRCLISSILRQVTFIVTMIVFVHAKFLILLLVMFPLFSVAFYRYNKSIRNYAKQERNLTGALNSQMQEGITGVRLIRNFNRTKAEINAFNQVTDDLASIKIKRGKIVRFYYPGLIFKAVQILTVVWGASEVNQSITVGEFFVLFMLVLGLSWPISVLGLIANEFQQGFAAADRLHQVITKDEYVSELNSKEQVYWDGKNGQIVFSNVSFSYNDQNNVINSFSLVIPAGSTVALVGPPGSGKSTLLKLLLRLYDPNEGEILIDEINTKNISLENLRNNIGSIEQEVFLFSRSVNENIAFGSSAATQKQIEKVAKLAEAHEFIINLPEQYDTVIGERGTKLSGGQKQRLIIARALLIEPTIILMDDVSSAIDAETEHKIQKAIANLIKYRTTLIITHRLATIKNADIILFMKKGKIIAQGPHNEMIEKCEDYFNLFRPFLALSEANGGN